MGYLNDTQQDALEMLRRYPEKGLVLHVAVGGALVKAGYAIKDDTKGHGKLNASYRLKV